MTKSDEINDAMVDTYRALREINRKDAIPAALSLVPGAGVDSRRVCKPGKRMRNLHRKSGSKASLKTYAHSATNAESVLAAEWRANKKASR